MFHLKNDTPFAAQIFLSPNRQGVDTLYLVVKATFDLTPVTHIAEGQQTIITEDIYWGEPGKSSLKYATEVHLEKPGTDVIVVGEACAPNDRPVSEMEVGLSIAGRICILKVFGDRYWKKGFLDMKPSMARPFLRMPIIYERAFGGMHVIDQATNRIFMEERNPLGKGFLGMRSEQELDDVEIPNIEDPKNLMKNPADKPRPVGFGAIAPYWQSRVSYSGTCDEAWQKHRAPFLPEDFDFRYNYAAHPDLIFTEYLKGGEPVVIANMSLRGRQQFNLPSSEPKIEVSIAGRFETVKANMETVLLEPTEERISLVWRATAQSDKKITDARVKVTL